MSFLFTNGFCVIMLMCVLSLLVGHCGSSRQQYKQQINRDYCQEKWLRDGGTGELEYNSFLWSIKRDGVTPTYLFGTIHAPSHLVWRYIPQNSQAALLDATHVYTEVDLKDPNIITVIRKCRQLPGNDTIKDVLPKDLFLKFNRVFKKFQKRSQKWKAKLMHSLDLNLMQFLNDKDLYNQYYKLKPMWLTSTILQQWNRFFIKQQLLQLKSVHPHLSLDSELVRLASDTYKGGIENVSSHCDPMDRLGKEKVHLALNVTLDALDAKLSGKFRMKENDIRHVINLYKCGDPMNTNRLESLFRDLVGEDLEKKLAEIDEYLSRELMFKRNILMADKIDSMLKSGAYESARMFFAVGAAHLLGNDSIVSNLRKKGYNIEHIGPKEDIPATIKIAEVIGRYNKNDITNSNNITKEPRDKDKDGVGDDRNVVIITKYENNYVYYYNSSTRSRPPDLTSLLLLLLLVKATITLLSGGGS